MTSSCNGVSESLKKLDISTSLQVSSNNDIVTVVDNAGHKERFNATWLRHVCHCSLCHDSSCSQKTIDLAELCPSYSVKDAHMQDDNLVIQWNEENHTGSIPLTFLRDNSCSSEAVEKRVQDKIPPVCKGPIPRISYQTILESDQGLWEWVKHLNEEGVCVVHGIPPDVTVKQAIEKIWIPEGTIYGEVFHVKSDPNPVNIAYTPKSIVGHMDLTYYDNTPGYQFLLCKRFDSCITGGENTTVDAWYEAERMKKIYPEEFATLLRVPATFLYHGQESAHMRLCRPHFTVDDYTGLVSSVRWGPLAEGPLSVREEDVAPYFKAQYRFAQMLKTSDSKVEFRLQEGEMLSFNNRRIVHSRNNFQLNGGYRMLEGCYINIDEMKKRAQVLSNKFNNGQLVKYVF